MKVEEKQDTRYLDHDDCGATIPLLNHLLRFLH